MINGVHSTAQFTRDHGMADSPFYLRVKHDRLYIGYGCEDAEPAAVVHHLADLGVVIVATEAQELFILSDAEFAAVCDPSPLAPLC